MFHSKLIRPESIKNALMQLHHFTTEIMFSSFSTSGQYGAKVKRNIFSKRKTHSINSDNGIDLKKIKVKFTGIPINGLMVPCLIKTST